MRSSMPETYSMINLDSLRCNIRTLVRKASPRELMAVVKADAYGHGLQECARVYIEEGVHSFGVSNLRDAELLRNLGAKGIILLLRHASHGEIIEASRINCAICVESVDDLYRTNQLVKASNAKLDIHIRVDFRNRKEYTDLIDAAKKQTHLTTSAIFSHLSDYGELIAQDAETHGQEFDSALRNIRNQMGFTVPCHIGGSATLSSQGFGMANMVRLGSAFYGIESNLYLTIASSLTPVLETHTTITAIRELKPGDFRIYGVSQHIDKNLRVGTIPVGYSNGYLSLAARGATVLVKDRVCRVLGAITMNQSTIDLSDTSAEVGEIVTLIGRQGNSCITADQLAKQTEDYPPQLTIRLGQALPRIFYENKNARHEPSQFPANPLALRANHLSL